MAHAIASLWASYCLRTLTSTDGMTADFYAFDMKFFGRDGDPHHQRAQGRQPGVYDITSKPPATIEWE
jgi:GMP synthase (glutamine-hydrolysing)